MKYSFDHRLHQSVSAIWYARWFWLFPVFTQQACQQNPALVDGVDAIGITVYDMDRAVDSIPRSSRSKRYRTPKSRESYEHLEGVFGCGCAWYE